MKVVTRTITATIINIYYGLMFINIDTTPKLSAVHNPDCLENIRLIRGFARSELPVFLNDEKTRLPIV
jgi:hypothetical protein